MQTTQTRTIHTIQALRAISEHSLYSGETTTRAPVSRETDGTAEQAEIWARRAAHANGFGGM